MGSWRFIIQMSSKCLMEIHLWCQKRWKNTLECIFSTKIPDNSVDRQEVRRKHMRLLRNWMIMRITLHMRPWKNWLVMQIFITGRKTGRWTHSCGVQSIHPMKMAICVTLYRLGCWLIQVEAASTGTGRLIHISASLIIVRIQTAGIYQRIQRKWRRILSVFWAICAIIRRLWRF